MYKTPPGGEGGLLPAQGLILFLRRDSHYSRNYAWVCDQLMLITKTVLEGSPGRPYIALSVIISLLVR